MKISRGDRETVNNRQRAVLLARRPLESFLRRVQEELGIPSAGVTVCLVSDVEIARLNEMFRKKKGPTDVLSFPMLMRRKPVRLGPSAGSASFSEACKPLANSFWPA